jgi:hypothetical protein
MQKLTLAALALFAAGSAHAIVIDFDNLAGGTALTDQFAEATFTTTSGPVLVRNISLFHSAPHVIAAHAGSRPDFIGDLLVTFTNPVENLSFWTVGGNTNGQQASIDIFVHGVLEGHVGLFGSGIVPDGAPTPDFHDLTGFSGITSIHIRDITDLGGLAYDTFQFDLSATTPPPVGVPEPGTLGLLGVGLAALPFVRRRRKSSGC